MTSWARQLAFAVQSDLGVQSLSPLLELYLHVTSPVIRDMPQCTLELGSHVIAVRVSILLRRNWQVMFQ